MMKFSVCIEALFSGREPAESIKIVRDSGFEAFEFWGWEDKDLAILNKAREQHGMKVSVFCIKGSCLVDASKRDEFLEGLKESIAVAKELECRTLIGLSGNELPGVPRGIQHASIVEGLKGCVPELEKAGITLVLEPLNVLVDHKGYYLYSSDEAFEIIDEVGSPYIKVLFDIYHQQITEGNLISRITRNIDKIGHFHSAGVPGRHELDSGELNYTNIIKSIEDTGYCGYFGLEYFPLADVTAGLKKLSIGL